MFFSSLSYFCFIGKIEKTIKSDLCLNVKSKDL